MADSLVPTFVGGLISAFFAGGLAYVGTVRAGAKTEGVLTTSIGEIGKRMDRHEEQNNDRFRAIETDNAKQWEVIRETQQEVGYLQGKANGHGKAAHAGGD